MVTRMPYDLSAAKARVQLGPRDSVTQYVTCIIREAIRIGSFVPGESLRQQTLSKVLDVSRGPIREAFIRLEAEGLLDSRTNYGVVVKPLKPREVRETFEILASLECKLLEIAIPNLIPADFNTCRLILNDMCATQDLTHWYLLERDFFNALYQAAFRPQMLSMVDKLHVGIDSCLVQQLENGSERRQLEEQSAVLLSLCHSKTVMGACRLLEDRLEVMAKLVDRAIGKSEQDSQST